MGVYITTKHKFNDPNHVPLRFSNRGFADFCEDISELNPNIDGFLSLLWTTKSSLTAYECTELYEHLTSIISQPIERDYIQFLDLVNLGMSQSGLVCY